MELHTATAGLLEVRTPGDVAERDGSLVIDLATGDGDALLELNGRPFRAESIADLAIALRARHSAEAGLLMSIPYDVGVEGSRVIIGQDMRVAESVSGAYLTGQEAQAAAEKASGILNSEIEAWPTAPKGQEADSLDLSGLVAGSRWDGPLVVSMPRTGSTLMGLLFLFCRDGRSSTGYRFDRYVHEPVAPVFWRGDGFESLASFVDPPLSDRDVVQESAYQFTDPRAARWLLSQARPPVVFTMRHPQLSWPSRWRAMLRQMLDEDTAANMETARRALAEDDFSGLGSYLTESVRPADNGFYAFIAMLGMCVRESIDFVIVDNTRFRAQPEATLRELCSRLRVEFEPDMTEWTNLQAVLPRVVMSDLALGDEYQWYYAQTLASDRGIQPESRPLLSPTRFPEPLRGLSDQYLTIDEAVTWHQLLLMRPETLP